MKWTPENEYDEPRCNMRRVSSEARAPMDAAAVAQNRDNILLAAVGLHYKHKKRTAVLRIQSWCRCIIAVRRVRYRRRVYQALLAERPSKTRQELARIGMEGDGMVVALPEFEVFACMVLAPSPCIYFCLLLA